MIAVVPRTRVAPLTVQGWDRHGNEAMFTLAVEPIRDRMTRLLRERGMSVQALADASGLPYASVKPSAIEPGVIAFTVYRIARALGVSMEYLIAGEEAS